MVSNSFETIHSVNLRTDEGKFILFDIFYLQKPVFSLYFVDGKFPWDLTLKVKFVIVTHSAIQDHLSKDSKLQRIERLILPSFNLIKKQPDFNHTGRWKRVAY